jgi:hypothetical protein
MKKFFYKMIAKYINFYVRQEDKTFELKPKNELLSKFLDCKNYTAIEDVSQISEDVEYVILNGTLHYESDIQTFLTQIHRRISANTRLIVTYYSALWSPLVRLATFLGLRKRTSYTNWITHEDAQNFALLSNFEVVQKQARILCPVFIPIISYLLNRWLLPLPFFRNFGLLNVMVLRPKLKTPLANASVSVVVPARNEAGNIEQIVQRLPKMGEQDELIFIEGGSSDNTWEEIQRVQEAYKDTIKIRSAKQDGKGKGDAVRKGFAMAEQEILMILDADMTVPPEDLPKFYESIKNDLGEFINGSRLVYPMEKGAMRFFNLIGNKFFAMAFSFTLGQPLKDTLCGTKVLSRKNYQKLAANRNYFGDFDPFGDFDLLFGASRMGLKIVELPITYKARTYGTTNIQRWKHGVILLRMLLFAIRRIKFL